MLCDVHIGHVPTEEVMSDRSAGPDLGPSTFDQIKRFGPPGLIALAALLFVLQNTDTAKFDFLWFTFEWPLWIMLVVFAAVGAVVFWALARRRRARRSDR